ncbi:MlaD family protein [Gordonia hirsuta]|uniref:MlaD family protein n=1 Tax=Gordonia hirsuta TaxID=53427 RepID=UPI000462B5DC|nr:MlaD family protein [Gordonia hirsuta]
MRCIGRTCRAGLAVLLATALALILSGCAQLFGIADRESTYRVDIEFESALNIPAGTRVLHNGVRVGTLGQVRLEHDVAVTSVDIDQGVRLPVDTGAELRQETLLGDLYIALSTPDDDGGPYLSDGGRIPVKQTSPPDNVETVMVSLSQFLNGGILVRSQASIAQLNDALPDDPEELSRLSRQAAAQLIEVGGATDAIDAALQKGAALAETVSEKRETVERVLTIGPDRFAKMQGLFLTLVGLISDLRVLTKPGGDLLVEPTHSDLKKILATADPWLMEIADADRSVLDNAGAVRDLLARKITPFLRDGGELDVRRIDDRNGQATQVADVLRAIGVV